MRIIVAGPNVGKDVSTEVLAVTITGAPARCRLLYIIAQALVTVARLLVTRARGRCDVLTSGAHVELIKTFVPGSSHGRGVCQGRS